VVSLLRGRANTSEELGDVWERKKWSRQLQRHLRYFEKQPGEEKKTSTGERKQASDSLEAKDQFILGNHERRKAALPQRNEGNVISNEMLIKNPR